VTRYNSETPTEFSKEEREALLAIKGIGPTVIKRFEEIGIYSLSELTRHNVEDIAEMVADMLHTTCWKNSPQAKQAIAAAIDLAKSK
jgi:predicted flap endonuclease-1-like 5' DNA nuclease